MKVCKLVRSFAVPAILLFVSAVFAMRLAAAPNPDWLRPFPPFRVAGNLYYVGSADLASYLIATPQGLILINSSFEASVPLIRDSVEKLGFKFSDIKVLLISHAHDDHCAGSARILKLTGREDFNYGANPSSRYPPARVDRVLHNGDTVRLGGTVLTAHLTPGHTKGTTTWTMDEKEGGHMLHVVIVGSPNVNPGYKLVGNKAYPQIAADYKRGFAVLESLPCDIFLGAHGAYFGLKEKYARWKNGDKNAFIDPDGYKAYIADRERVFEAELQRQSAAK
jgi:metallo-beta-lactamase class B